MEVLVLVMMTHMNTAKITVARVSLAAATLVFLGSCASPRTSDGLLERSDGLPESVVQLNRPEDIKTVKLHLEKIEVRQKAVELAKQRDARLRQLVEAGRASTADTLVGTIGLARARVAVLDAKLGLARTGLLSSSKPTMIDTDGDGLPDLRHDPLRVDELLGDKVEVLQGQHEACKLAHERILILAKAGRASDADVSTVALRMHKVEASLNDAKDAVRAQSK